jgi:hypothetical protein
MILISFEAIISLVNTALVGQHRELQRNHRLKHYVPKPALVPRIFTGLLQETASLQAKFGGEK